MSRNVSILSVVTAVILFSVLAVVTVAFAEQEEGRGLGQEKVTLCHNGHLIKVGEPAKEAHLNHGDNKEGASGATAAPSTPGSMDTTTGTTTDTTGTTGTSTMVSADAIGMTTTGDTTTTGDGGDQQKVCVLRHENDGKDYHWVWNVEVLHVGDKVVKDKFCD